MTAARPRIALALGDPAGIGPEIALKALRDPGLWDLCEPVLVGELAVLQRHGATCGIAVTGTAERAVAIDGRPVALEPVPAGGAAVPLGVVSPETGRATVAYAERAIRLAEAGAVDAVVACPHNETAVNAAGIRFDGYPGFLADTLGVPRDDVFLMLVSDRFRIVNVTLHVSTRTALDQLTVPRILAAARAADRAARRLGVARPRLCAFGINPHAGENGLFGREDEEITRVAVAEAAAEGIAITGPLGADLALAQGDADVYLAMFHDQAHIPIKLLGAGTALGKLLGADGASGLPIGTDVLFSSVPHGSAYDIAGRDRADPSAITGTLRRLAGVVRR